MHRPLVLEAIEALWGKTSSTAFLPINDGLINFSFKIKGDSGKLAFLQQLNSSVFPDAGVIAENLDRIYAALRKKNSAQLIATPLTFCNGEKIHTDSSGNCWRASAYIESKTFHRPLNNEQLGQAVEGFARYTALLSDLDPASLYPTIKDFHNLTLRYNQFNESVEKGYPERVKHCAPLIDQLIQREGYARLFSQMQEASADFKMRVMHHDAKLSNLLFDETGTNLLAITDLDTTMPGYFFSDMGDMVRSMAASVDENCVEINKAVVVPNVYDIIYSKYRQIMLNQLTPAEEQLLHSAGLLMIYMQSLRFLTDHLLGDTYYQIQRPSQNRERASHQLALLHSLEELLKTKYRFSLL